MNLRSFLLICLPWIVAGAISSFSEDPKTTLPQDAAALMRLGYESNGLVGQDIRPWHIRGRYRSYDRDGKVEYDGIYEEWWYSPTRYLRSWSGSHLTQTDYAMGDTLQRTGEKAWPSGSEMLLREMLIEPLPEAGLLAEFNLKRENRSAAKVKLECIAMMHPIRGSLEVSASFFPTACFSSDLPLLRVLSTGSSAEAIYDDMVIFQGHYLARHLRIETGNQVFAEMNLDVIETTKDAPEARVVPPQDAIPVDLTQIDEKSGTSIRFPELLRKAAPVYPMAAKSERVQGTGDMDVVIGEDGHVRDVKVTGGPPLLRRAAEDAVREWLYRPFIVMGRACPVKTQIHVIFSLG